MDYNYNKRTEVQVGDEVTLLLPYSEVCMYMQVAGKIMRARILARGVQLLRENGTMFSAPILRGEAGIYTEQKGSGWVDYYYPPLEVTNAPQG